jgi:hypothetical protein
MKKIAFIILTVTLIVLGCSKTDDLPVGNDEELQLKSADSRTVNYYWGSAGFYTPVYCEGVIIDYLYGNPETLHSHGVYHLVDDVAKWANIIVKGTVKSESTGEIFKINEVNKLVFDENEDIISHTCRTHAKGDKGTNVIMFFTVIDFNAGEMVLEKAICAPNKK